MPKHPGRAGGGDRRLHEAHVKRLTAGRHPVGKPYQKSPRKP